MNIKDMALKAAHPYQPPIAGKWQEQWLERYTAIVLEEAAKAESVKQEPVAWRYNSNGDWIYKDRKVWDDAEPLYAAPVDAKAILEMRDKAFQSYVDQAKADRELSVLQARLEALEEAAKVCYLAIYPHTTGVKTADFANKETVEKCAAAIRGLAK